MANLFDPPGRPFGYAWLEERTKIEDHVLRRTGYKRDLNFEFRVSKIQDRLHKYDLTFRERQEKFKAERFMGPRTFLLDLTEDELHHLVDLFGTANNPLSASIGEKAKAMLDNRAG